MEVLRHRSPAGLTSRLQQRAHADTAKPFGAFLVSHRRRRLCRNSRTDTITRAPAEGDQQQQQQRQDNSSNGGHNQWEARDNLVDLITALPMPSPQEVLDNSVSQPATKTWEDVPEGTKRKVQTPGFLKRFWRAYVTALDKHPIAVKSATSFFGFMIGDLLAQTITGHGAYDIFRTLRLVAFGVTLDGPVGHVWYTLLDRKVFPNEPTSNRAVVCKMLADQLLWAPFFSCVFFVFTNVLAGHPEMVLPSIQAKLLPMMIANFAVWPIAHLINFKFIPSQQRILYINCCQILWSAYLSNLSAGRTKTR